MIDRQALDDALGPPEMFGTFTEGNVLIRRAARERLAQLQGLRLQVWWCTEHDASFQREAIPGPPTWDCWAGPIEDEHCAPILLDAFKALDGEQR